MKNILQKRGVISLLGSLISILAGFLLGFVLLLVINPSHALSGFENMLLTFNPIICGRISKEARIQTKVLLKDTSADVFPSESAVNSVLYVIVAVPCDFAEILPLELTVATYVLLLVQVFR